MYKLIGQSVENNDFSAYIISQFCHIQTHIRLSENLPLGHSSSTAPVLAGVPQATVHFFFWHSALTYPPIDNKSEARLLADDCLPILSNGLWNWPTATPGRPCIFRTFGEGVADEVALEKYVVIQVSRKRNTINTKYILLNHQLESVKYLGVTISKL